MSKPDVTVSDWAPHLRDCRFVVVKLSAQAAADVLEVIKQCNTSCCDASLDQSAFNELACQLQCLTGLPEPSRVE